MKHSGLLERRNRCPRFAFDLLCFLQELRACCRPSHPPNPGKQPRPALFLSDMTDDGLLLCKAVAGCSAQSV